MILGVVNAELEATIHLSARGESDLAQEVEAVIDTGFSGFLTLPSSLIASLELPWLCRQNGMLADGNLHVFDVYIGTIDWLGGERIVEVEAVEAQPLIGMGLLHRCELRVQVLDGGEVRVEGLP